MAINTPADLFLWELSGQYDAEKKSTQMLGEIIGQVRSSGAAEVLRSLEQQGQVKIRNLEGCFQAIGTQPREIPCRAVDGMRAEFQEFLSQGPSPECIEMYSVGAALKLSHFGQASYKGLVDKSVLMGETACAQLLQTNLVMKEEGSGALIRISHDMSQRVLATA
jgi:ferritin-like metal-binding protein YciE